MTTKNQNGPVSRPLAEGQRWSAGGKRQAFLRLLRGEWFVALSRELKVEIYRLEPWREKALTGIDKSLKSGKMMPFKRNLTQPMRRQILRRSAGMHHLGAGSLQLMAQIVCQSSLVEK